MGLQQLGWMQLWLAGPLNGLQQLGRPSQLRNSPAVIALM